MMLGRYEDAPEFRAQAAAGGITLCDAVLGLAGVGVFRDPPVFLVPGDRVRCQADGIGTVENPVVDWSDVPDDAGTDAD